ncbi:MAG: flagellar type III secretion system protein FlhB [Burkholderiales bacterium]|nr:flagellar type III secretion system protein FlhB [Burkholderiales bacterium]
MQDAHDQERSLPASPRRLEQAREEGRVARSRELPGFLLVALGAAVLWGAGEAALEAFRAFLRTGLEFGAREAFDRGAPLARLGAAAAAGFAIAAPFFAAAFALAAASPVAVGGWTFSARAFAPDFSRLDPVQGLRRIFSLPGLAELVKAIAKAAAIGALAAWTLWTLAPQFAALAREPAQAAIVHALALAAQTLAVCAAGYGLVAAADVPLALWQYRRALRMSFEEVRREHKETEGDPQLKARVRSLQREMARRRMMQAVPKADVVVTNPEHYAVAIGWREGAMRAPQVLAKGRGALAERIRAIARASGVPLLAAPPLARALYRHVEVGESVPQALYEAVAQALAWVYQLRAAHAAGVAAPPPPQTFAVPAQMDPAEADR